MCCGQKRAELRNSQVQSSARSVPQPTSGNSPARAVRTQSATPPAVRTSPSHPPAYSPTRSVQPQVPAPTSTPQSAISVRYLETSPIRVRGLVSGQSYEFSGVAPVQLVDARDASSLLNTRFFRRA
jgi:hypothetical protein